MGLIDWTAVLPDFDVEVIYSTLATDSEPDEFDQMLAELRLRPNEYCIDVSWIPEDGQYAVRLFEKFFENAILIRFCKSLRDVLFAVIELADRTKVDNSFESIDGITEADADSASNSFVAIE